jgi:DNA replication protein DnaC
VVQTRDLGALTVRRPDPVRTVVIDDIGLLPVATEAAEGLYRVVDAAYEKRSAPISSNLRPAGFDELMPKTLATATVDRLLHHAHVCQTSGDIGLLPVATDWAPPM